MSDQPTRPRRGITAAPGFVEEVELACERMLGQRPDRILAPGGSFRDSVRVVLGERNVVMTRRKETERGLLEVDCLRRLSGAGAPVPRPLGYDGVWMVQEHIAGPRLSIAFAEADEAERTALVEDAVASLFEISDAAAESGLAEVAPALGATRDWVERVVARPGRLADAMGVPLPPWDTEACVERLVVPCTRFVKWDARPANAILDDRDRIVWIDWEHAGCRLGVEDFAWMSGDEYFTGEVADVAAAVAAGLEERGAPVDAYMDYLAVFATMHASVRLELVWNKLRDKGWRDAADVLRRDSVGASRQNAALLMENARAWAARSVLTAPLAGWFSAVADRLEAWEPGRGDGAG